MWCYLGVYSREDRKSSDETRARLQRKHENNYKDSIPILINHDASAMILSSSGSTFACSLNQSPSPICGSLHNNLA